MTGQRNENTGRSGWSAFVRRLAALATVLMALDGGAVVAQQSTLTLEDAVDLARRNNPGFLSTQNDQASADWAVREAYAALIPTVNATTSAGYRGQGEVRVGTITLDNQVTDWVSSSYNIGFNWRLDGNTIFGLGNATASREATEAGIDAASFNLESTVAFQYMATLRAQDGVDVAASQVERSQENLDIVNTRVATGAAAGTDLTQAEVDLGRAEVQLIQAERLLTQSRYLLAEQIGMPLEDDVVLSSESEVFEPTFELTALVSQAMETHPSLVAFRATERASRSQARAVTTSQYLPSITVGGGFSAYSQQALNDDFVLAGLNRGVQGQIAQCDFDNLLHNGLIGGLPGYTTQDCNAITLDPQIAEQALAANSTFPFDFTKNPFQVGVTISLPIFTGFNRQRQIADANNVAHDAELNRRAEELRLRTLVNTALSDLESSYRLVQAEERNRDLAETLLGLEQRRYALGASALLLLLDAQASLMTAEQSYLNAVYDFHYNLIALEAAVGQPLGPS